MNSYKFKYKAVELPITGGLYIIENRITHRMYVGSTSNLRKRWNLHRHLLRKGIHHSPYLQNSWRKHGEENFHFAVIQYTDDPKVALMLEQHFLDTLKPKYNIATIANSTAGVKKSPETRAKIAAANRRPEKREWARQLGSLPKSETHKRKISESHKGKKVSEETRAKLRIGSAKRWAKYWEDKNK